MSKFEIKIYDEPVLRQTARAVDQIDERVREIAQGMIEAMYEGRGIGLAANQVGLLDRIIVVDVEWSEKRNGKNAHPPNPTVMINPEIIAEDPQDEKITEGCLSLPEIEGDVWRPGRIRYRYVDLAGNKVEKEAGNLLARCIQHEVDHLNGILFIDRMAPDERRRLAGKLARLRKRREAAVS